MNVRFGMARMLGTVSAWILRHVFRRPAANFPGKVGLLADPALIAGLRGRIGEGCIVVIGTNGKTTVTNLIADTLEAGGKTIACNRTGANLDSGIATALLLDERSDWGVLECDELWLSRVAPQLQPTHVVLLNLFRDQLDRMGELALIQDRIVDTLHASPQTTLIYNCDDPLCQAIADRTDNLAIPFGISEDLGLAANTVADSDLCQRCDEPLSYKWRQYGQLGNYACPLCGFARADPACTASAVRTTASCMSLTLSGSGLHERIEAPFSGAYMTYNVLAAFAANSLADVPFAAFAHAVGDFNPQNGRLQRYRIGTMDVLLNLAKNPTGFNQNLRIIEADKGAKAVGFFINDKEADGHDVSWLWDVDFQELSQSCSVAAFAGGTRWGDLQVRLKHAGIDAPHVRDAREFLDCARAGTTGATCYLIANYTALPAVKAQLDRMAADIGNGGRGPATAGTAVRAEEAACTAEAEGACEVAASNETADASAAQKQRMPEGNSHGAAGAGERRFAIAKPSGSSSPACEGEHLTIAHLYPKLLNLYGDGGNVTILANRALWRGMEVTVRQVDTGQDLDLSDVDIVFLGGGPDREQYRASQELVAHADALRQYAEDDGVLLAICGGYQILGREWIMDNRNVDGLRILDSTTRRADGNARNRLVGNIALRSPLATMPVIGYENHAGRTYLGEGCAPFGTVIGHRGYGNNESDGADGLLYRNVIGTYLHGPLLAKNPEVADWLTERALARRAAKEGRPAPGLPPLDDAQERAANASMCARLKIR